MIAVFDSGFGGLTVLKEILKILPEYDYLYLGDQAHVPYGPRSPETVCRFTEQNVLWLFDKGAQIIVIACNSATAAALRHLQHKYPEKHILGVVVPAAEKAVRITRYGRIGIVGTSATINSQVYVREIEKLSAQFYRPKDKKSLKTPQILQQACPLLVPLIEENWWKKPETRSIMRKYLIKPKTHHPDTLILGCTHYPILEADFKRIMGKNCTVVNASHEQALALKNYLKQHPDLEKTLGKNHGREFFTTDCPEKFASLGSLFLGQRIEGGKKVEVVK